MWMDVVYLSGRIIHDLRMLGSVYKLFWLNVHIEFTNRTTSKIERDLTNGPLSKLLDLLDTQV